MAAKYEGHPTKVLMVEFARELLRPGQVFGNELAVRWFADRYPKIRSTTVKLHVEGMSVNSRNRRHAPNIRPTSGHDLFFKVGKGQYRLWERETDPPPVYSTTLRSEPPPLAQGPTDGDGNEEQALETGDRGGSQFALEAHLRDYLARNLGVIEPGLRVYEDEGISGVEFEVGGRFIDILAVDGNNNFVVVELKVSRGYDRTVGQLLRYMGWIEKNLADGRKVRGLIVASQITDDLRLACSRIADVALAEYELSMKLRPINAR